MDILISSENECMVNYHANNNKTHKLNYKNILTI